ncbi:hypothetical protein [Ferroacidibacillus organovorans]|uniref:Uncharacterized protein n=1 Tax=Ferroacidibacillus organovorans TaxID=1765683 RepID=A0A1V4ETW3_9BACL|nr:hypothetical protein [Ferroacidibacillus organovorans]OPG16376.1 hypothetical protein B2M26_05710 [Ferroacidibacillus organovorans]
MKRLILLTTSAFLLTTTLPAFADTHHTVSDVQALASAQTALTTDQTTVDSSRQSLDSLIAQAKTSITLATTASANGTLSGITALPLPAQIDTTTLEKEMANLKSATTLQEIKNELATMQKTIERMKETLSHDHKQENSKKPSSLERHLSEILREITRNEAKDLQKFKSDAERLTSLVARDSTVTNVSKETLHQLEKATKKLDRQAAKTQRDFSQFESRLQSSISQLQANSTTSVTGSVYNTSSQS